MDKKVICLVNLFSMNQKLYYIDENGSIIEYNTTINNMSNNAYNICKENKCNKIEIYGDTSYVQNIKEKIKTYAATENIMKNLRIEVKGQ